VVKAFDEKLHRFVAIKLTSPLLAATSAPRKRFVREARSAAAVRHEDVIAIYAVEDQLIPYLVMEYIAGITERLTEEERTCGVCVIDLTTGQVVALLRFETAVQEVFAVTVLPGRRYPELINDDDKLLENSFTVPDAAPADVPASLRAPAEPTRGAAEG
jgi:hypothetical protein